MAKEIEKNQMNGWQVFFHCMALLFILVYGIRSIMTMASAGTAFNEIYAGVVALKPALWGIFWELCALNARD